MKRNIKLLAAFNFFTDLRFNFVILILYFAQITGSYALSMSLFSVVYVSSALLEVPTGVFSDLIGRKKTIIAGALCSMLAMVLYAIGQNYPVLFIGALAEGLSRSWYSGNNDALLYDTLHSLNKKDLFAEYMGKLSSMFQVALGISAVTGSILANWSFSAVMWLSVIPQVICVFLALFFIEPPSFKKESSNIFAHLDESLIQFKKNPTLQWLSLRSAINYAIGESMFHFRSAFIQMVWPTWALGIAQALSNIGATVGYWYSGRLIRRVGAAKILIINDIYSRITGSIALGFLTVFSPVLASSSSLFYGITQVAKDKLLHERFTNEQRATMSSLNSFLESIFFGIFSILLGILGDRLRPNIAMLIGQLCLIPSLLIIVILYKQKKI